jgi:hypothetical protein
MPLIDEFPSTQRSFIARTLADGDLERANNHVMERAHAPLCAYARSSSLRHMASPGQSASDFAADLVGGYFASRFGREDYLRRWLNGHPMVPLRRWLVNGLLLYAREVAASSRRPAGDRRGSAPPTEIESAPWQILERTWRDEILQTACDNLAARYAREGQSDSWRLVIRHIIDGASYAELERELEIPAARAPMITRTALRRLRVELEALLADEIAEPWLREHELSAMLLGPGQGTV